MREASPDEQGRTERGARRRLMRMLLGRGDVGAQLLREAREADAVRTGPLAHHAPPPAA